MPASVSVLRWKTTVSKSKSTLVRDIRGRARDAISIHLLVTVGLLVITCLSATVKTHPEELIRPISFVQLGLVVWMLWSWKWVTGTLFDPYILFVLAATMFHAGQQLLECLDLNTGGFLFGLFPPEISFRAALLVLWSFALLHFGALISLATSRNHRMHPALDDSESKRPIAAFGWVLFIVSVIPAALSARQALSATMSGGYFYAMFAHQRATSFAGARDFFGAFLVPSTLFLLAGSRKDKSLARVLSAVVVLLYCAVFLFIGARTVAAISLPVYAWLWDRLVRPISRGLIISSLLVGSLVVFPLVAVTRNTSGDTRLSWDYLKDAWSELKRPAAAGLSETGGSLVTVAYTLELVPAVRDFDWGVTYAFALTTVVPNLFWETHPAIMYGSPGNWMMSVIDPDTFAAGGGLGYSFIAEAYYNFGWGGPLFIAFLGFFLGRLVSWSSYSDPLRCVCIANVLMPLLWASRNDASGAFRNMIWLGLIPYVAIQAFRAINNRKQLRAGPLV